MKKVTDEEILQDYVEVSGPLDTPCWITPYPPNEYGYTRIDRNRKKVRGHRFFYEKLIGPIPKKFHLDHLCRVRHCVNPAHLEPVTHRVNVLRGEGLAAVNAKKTHCSKGHILSGDNVYYRPDRPGNRECRQCHRHANTRYDLKRVKIPEV